MKNYVVFMFLLLNILTIGYTQTVINISDIDVLASENGDSLLEINEANKVKIKNMLYLAIRVSVNNIVNYNTTISSFESGPYQYQYILYDHDYNVTVERKVKIREVYIPSHPDAQKSGEMKGYVLMPDIDSLREEEGIDKILRILESIDHMELTNCYTEEKKLDQF